MPLANPNTSTHPFRLSNGGNVSLHFFIYRFFIHFLLLQQVVVVVVAAVTHNIACLLLLQCSFIIILLKMFFFLFLFCAKKMEVEDVDMQSRGSETLQEQMDIEEARSGDVEIELKDLTREGLDKADPSQFELLKVLGEGSFGKVFLVRKITGKDAGTLYAMKVSFYFWKF